MIDFSNGPYSNTPLRAAFTIHLDGPAVRQHRVALQDIAVLGQQLQTALNRVARILLGQQASNQPGPLPAEIEQACTLELVALRGGSIELVCDLPAQRQLSFDNDLGEEALMLLVQGLESAGIPHAPLPRGYDQGVVMALRDSGKLLDRGIDQITYQLHSRSGKWTARYTPAIRSGLILRAQEPIEQQQTIEGRLVMGDFQAKHFRCKVQLPSGRAITCTFDETQQDSVLRALRQWVRVSGIAVERDGELQTLRIERIEVLRSVAPIIAAERQSHNFFGEHPTIEQLAAEQGVTPVQNAATMLGNFWPADETTSEFLATLRSWRQDPEHRSYTE
ncbi:MAG: OB-fold nucleic acid binding domain-containing protein [Chloroflexota bacterium]|nr:OB-fold nucleic acid binding domain-containing protein [Chloroflexota bacterium]